jgi:hypothetical protein
MLVCILDYTPSGLMISSASRSLPPTIKTHLSPAAFPTTLSFPLVPFPLSYPFLHHPPRALRPRRAPPTSLSGALAPTEWTRRRQSARLLTLIRSTPRQHCKSRSLSEVKYCISPFELFGVAVYVTGQLIVLLLSAALRNPVSNDEVLLSWWLRIRGL